jgi:hypothetical protein
VVTKRGRGFFADFGIDLEAIGRQRRCFCKICIDLTERRPHVAGALAPPSAPLLRSSAGSPGSRTAGPSR